LNPVQIKIKIIFVSYSDSVLAINELRVLSHRVRYIYTLLLELYNVDI
jgi:hypothetical protein